MDSEIVLAELNHTNKNVENINGFKFMLKNINMAAITLTDEMLASGIIKKIHPLGMLETRIKDARRIINADCAFEKGITGKGVGVAILDTGLSPIADFNGRIPAFKDWVNGKDSPYDNNGHGTHVAGICASDGSLSKGLYRGIAPGANIIPIKILDKYGRGNSLATINGIQWVIDNKDRYNIRVINISAGTSDRAINIPLVRAAEAAIDCGIAVIAADGNGTSKNVITSPGISPRVITVGSDEDYPSIRTYKSGSFSKRFLYRKPDIYAPGSEIVSCLSPTYRFDERIGAESMVTDCYYIKMSGSSMATPIISGAAALIFEKYPQTTPEELKNILTHCLCDNTRIPMPDIRKIFNL